MSARRFTFLLLVSLVSASFLNFGLIFGDYIDLVESQVLEFYDLDYIKGCTLDMLNWSIIDERLFGSVDVVIGLWDAGSFTGYSSESHLMEITLHMAAVVFIPSHLDVGAGLVYALHTQRSLTEVNRSFYVEVCEEYGMPILLYGERPVDWESLGYEGRGDLIHVGYSAIYFLNRDSVRDVVTGNFALALARTQSYAITLLQDVCRSRGFEIDRVGFIGGSKEGYAQWFAATMDDRISVSCPGGFHFENFTLGVEYMFKQWGDYNPYLPNNKPQPLDLAPIYQFITSTEQGRSVERVLSIICRLDLLKPDVYIISGDVCGYNMHDGRNYPLGCETSFLENFPYEWRYVRALNNSEKPFLKMNKVETTLQLLKNPDLIKTWPKVKATSLVETDGGVKVKARMDGEVSEAYLMYGFSKDKVWNSPSVKWSYVRLEKKGGMYGAKRGLFHCNGGFFIRCAGCRGYSGICETFQV